MIDKFEPTIEDLGRVADRLTGHGIAGLVPEDWPTLVAAMEDYIAIRRDVADWDNKVERAVRTTSEITRLTAALSSAEAERDRMRTIEDAAKNLLRAVDQTEDHTYWFQSIGVLAQALNQQKPSST